MNLSQLMTFMGTTLETPYYANSVKGYYNFFAAEILSPELVEMNFALSLKKSSSKG